MNEKLIHTLKGTLGWAYFVRTNLCSNPSDKADEACQRIEELKGAIKELEQEANPPLATACEGADTVRMSERHEQEHLIYALHDVSKELIRTTGEIRSLLLVLSKFDLCNLEKTNMKISELSGVAADIKTSALKGFSEIRKRIDELDLKIVDLVKQLADAEIPAAAEADLKDAQALLKQLDDITPDVTELPPPAPV